MLPYPLLRTHRVAFWLQWKVNTIVLITSNLHCPHHYNSNDRSASHLFSAFINVISGSLHGTEWLILLQVVIQVFLAFMSLFCCVTWNALPCGTKAEILPLVLIMTAPGPPFLSSIIWELAWEANHHLVCVEVECVINSNQMVCKETSEHNLQVRVSVFGLITLPPTKVA